MTLGEARVGSVSVVTHVGGERSFRRRLMELGLLPGTKVEVVRVAPLGDPLELRVRGCLLSIRREEARAIDVEPRSEPSANQAALTALAPDAPASP